MRFLVRVFYNYRLIRGYRLEGGRWAALRLAFTYAGWGL